MNAEEFCKSLPKIELHAHLNGSLSEKTLRELGCFDYSLREYSKLTNSINKNEHTLDECFALFKIAHNATNNRNSVYLATKSVISEFADENVIYLELRTTPREEQNMSKEEYIETVVRAITENKHDIIVKLILSIDRRHNSIESEKSLDLILKMKTKYPNIIRGIDLSGNPSKGKFDASLFEKAKKNGLQTAIHCAEVKNDKEVEDILTFCPDRIGHATFLHPNYGGTQKNWDLLLQKRIPTECCLTSNVVCGTSKSYQNHHIQEWINTKLPFSINTDDKGVFCTTLSKEYELVLKHCQLSYEDMWQISCDAINHSFALEDEKKILQIKMEDWKQVNL